jgi:hypothetical protein
MLPVSAKLLPSYTQACLLEEEKRVWTSLKTKAEFDTWSFNAGHNILPEEADPAALRLVRRACSVLASVLLFHALQLLHDARTRCINCLDSEQPIVALGLRVRPHAPRMPTLSATHFFNQDRGVFGARLAP